MIICMLLPIIHPNKLFILADSVSTEYLFFKNASIVATGASPDAVTDPLAEDGYVKVDTSGTSVTVTAVANTGYDFMMLNLTDKAGNVTTPLSKDYVKTGNSRVEVSDSNFTYTFTVDSGQATAVASDTIGTVYSEMPSITAYFDPQGEVLNDTLLNMEPTEKKQSKVDSVTSWLGSTTGTKRGTLNAGVDWWDGVDAGNGDYVVYDAGEGKKFSISGISVYSRRGWSNTRFTGVIEGSSDGVTYTPIVTTVNTSASQKYSIQRITSNTEANYQKIRLRATATNTDINLVKLYGSVIDSTSIITDETEYQFFKAGVKIATGAAVEVVDPSSYEGYVKVERNDTVVKVTAVANTGYDFMLLDLTDKDGNVTTPLSKDYVKVGESNARITDNSYSYTFVVDSMKATDLTTTTIGITYSEMPTITALFDPSGELLNDDLLGMIPLYSQQSKADAVTCWLDTVGRGTLNAGSKSWDGQDIAQGDYVTYYAGQDKAFCIEGTSIYSRRDFSNTRFTAVIEGSNDGDTFTPILATENATSKEIYSIKRMISDKSVKYRLIRIKASAKNTDINLLKIYGNISEVSDEDLTKVGQKEDDTVYPTITNYEVQILETVSEAGFIHPGVGITKADLENLRTQIKEKQDPWYSYYKTLVTSKNASRDFSCNNSSDGVTPSSYAYDSQGMKDRAANDGAKAYTQALLYYITGDEVYRSNALRIIRIWEQMDPAKYKYFVDAHIHTGIGLYRMIQAAEILRYTSCQSEALVWTEQDTEKFTQNVVDPSVNTFMNFNDKFMNQHSFPLYGTLSAAIFKNDREAYEQKVEWTTVNATAPVPYYTGSIYWQYRLMTQNDQTGESLAPADYNVQLVEMGRDLAHAGDDVATLITLARIINTQNTKVDPTKGTVSNDPSAVDVYSFLDNRILKATDYFCKFSMGYDVKWLPVKTSEAYNDYPQTLYTIPSDEYRGRLQNVSLSELYYVYIYRLGYTEEQLESIAPYFVKAFKQRFGPVYYSSGSGENTDLGQSTADEFWLFIPQEVVADDNATAKYIPESSSEDTKYIFEMENSYSIINEDNKVVASSDTICTVKDSNIGYIKTKASQNDTMFAVYKLSLINRKKHSVSQCTSSYER
ncbi:MAG TPA: discoidin domain-containing protein [Lachnospiraceae bacterium]|nr:discoidin domain-containing protein [Lachnospiraceae bacterium]